MNYKSSSLTNLIYCIYYNDIMSMMDLEVGSVGMGDKICRKQ